MVRIVLPQACMRVLPALATTWVSLSKDTPLVSIIINVEDLSYVPAEGADRDVPHA
jgi:polar amino acid transport system permease protein